MTFGHLTIIYLSPTNACT